MPTKEKLQSDLDSACESLFEAHVDIEDFRKENTNLKNDLANLKKRFELVDDERQHLISKVDELRYELQRTALANKATLESVALLAKSADDVDEEKLQKTLVANLLKNIIVQSGATLRL